MNKINFFSFEYMHPPIREEIIKKLIKVLDSNSYILGEEVKQFESQYAEFCQCKYCIGVGNGLDALVISLKTLGIGKGDEVILPANTYIATFLAISMVGAKPVPVEPRIETYNINPEKIESEITDKTKVIIPVHLYGQSCEMDAIIQVALKHNLHIVEDNAQAQGATYNGKKTSSFGNINTTSFYPAKNIGALGDAGAITTNDRALYEKACIIRDYGSEKKYYNEFKGVNSRLDELQAAVLSVKIKRLNDWNNKRQKIAQIYDEELNSIPEIILPKTLDNCTSVFHQYLIRIDKRDELQGHLTKNNIRTLIHYPVPPYLQKA
ncbi:MAG: DegT/DnrJ/EryC1/StrS family aminotransferase, partial [Cytophagales bacterium]|nr:DegT/DnrJ/EryC1/StrS family aminotransferase [Cytophagales bacterium]